ncbi:MAG TPA: hypothetical protein VEL28_17885 [Candidatus Binatia bacterium]|nr:hypothetical protein [Candidatus Binatia bacterium]
MATVTREPLASRRLRIAPSPPAFDGSDDFAVADDGAMLDELEGSIVDGSLVAELPLGSQARLPIQLALVPGQPALRLDLVGGQVAADVTASGCSSGRVGGAITAEDLQDKFLPDFAQAMDAHIPAQCRPGAATGDYSMCDLVSKSYLGLFDDDPRDGTITTAEVRDRDLVAGLIQPDVDLMDESGNYLPDAEGEPDSLSFGVGFDCVVAEFAE